MTRHRSYRVKELAELSRISVRTLHYYDEIGLLVPKTRTGSGYRSYDDDDLTRLQQILIGRELGLALEEIRRSLDEPEFDRKAALLRQRKELEARARQTDAMLRAIDAALAALQPQGESSMDMKTLFDGFDPNEHEAEAKARWGESDSYRESQKRSANYDASDWQRIRVEQAANYRALSLALGAGKTPSDPDVMDLAEQHRLVIERWFYPCNLARHVALAELYEVDPRFAANIDRYGAGLTPFLAEAIRANAARVRAPAPDDG